MNSVESHFRSITARYDLLNRVLSLGLDRSWRRRAAAGMPPGRILDVAAGSGDLALELAAPGRLVVALDPVESMLRLARSKAARAGLRLLLVVGRAEALPFRSHAFQGATAAFGVRNFADRAAGLREMARILGHGGEARILEFGLVRSAFLRPFQGLYLSLVVPLVGGLLTGRLAAYLHLARSIPAFPAPAAFEREMASCGLAPTVAAEPCHGGIAWVYRARRTTPGRRMVPSMSRDECGEADFEASASQECEAS